MLFSSDSGSRSALTGPSRRSLLVLGCGALTAGCGVRLDDFGPEPTPDPDAAETARDTIAIALDRLRGTWDGLSGTADPTAGAAAEALPIAESLLGLMGGVYANTSSTVTPTPEPYTPDSDDPVVLLDELDEQQSAVADAIAAGIADLDDDARAAAGQTAGSLQILSLWWAAESDREAVDLGALDEAAEAEQLRLEDDPEATAETTAEPRDAAALEELLDTCHAGAYLVELRSVQGDDAAQSRSEELLEMMAIWAEQVRPAIVRTGGTAPEPAAGYQEPEGMSVEENLDAVIQRLDAALLEVLGSDGPLVASPAAWMQQLGGLRWRLHRSLEEAEPGAGS